MPHVIYNTGKTPNGAQLNYTTTKKELLAMVYALKKFRQYLIDHINCISCISLIVQMMGFIHAIYLFYIPIFE